MQIVQFVVNDVEKAPSRKNAVRIYLSVCLYVGMYNVCMYVHTCVCMLMCLGRYVCMYIYTCIMYVYVCVTYVGRELGLLGMYICMYVCVYVLYVCMYCMRICMYVCVYVCKYVHMYVYLLKV